MVPPVDPDVKDSISARKVQKADREKLRRDRLNEQFQELGNALDPDRPKNDKATILSDALQMLKDLTNQVNVLKAEYASLLEESHELTQEKNELKEEKLTLKADIEGLNAQCQQRFRTMLPWSNVNHSMMMHMHPPPYPYSLPVPFHSSSSAPIAMHPPLQPYPGFLPFSSHCNPQVEQPPTLLASSHTRPGSSRSQLSCLEDSIGRSSNHRQNTTEKDDDFSNVATVLELKTPGSAPTSCSQSTSKQDTSSTVKKDLKSVPSEKNGPIDGSSRSNRYSASFDMQDSSSGSVGDGSIDEN